MLDALICFDGRDRVEVALARRREGGPAPLASGDVEELPAAGVVQGDEEGFAAGCHVVPRVDDESGGGLGVHGRGVVQTARRAWGCADPSV